jgi:type II secretory pathway pseudopilin PulG
MTLNVLTSRCRAAFSLVEALAAVAIIGIVTFLALPNLVQLKSQGDRNAAKARAQAFNFGIAAYVNSQGLAAGAVSWNAAGTAARYSLVQPYLSFSEASVEAYMPSGFSIDLANYTIDASGVNGLQPIPLLEGTTSVPY